MAVQNRALNELQSLLDMQGQAQDSKANLKKLEDARRDFVSGSPEDAKFATPEALATAVGVGWIFGPVGGLLMGIAQGILGKQQRQGALDAYMHDMNVLGETNSVFNDELDRLVMSATSDDDVAQLSALQTQKDAALRMMSSASPELQQQGSALLSDFSTRLNDYALTQETQRIEAEAFDAQLRRDLEQEQYDRYTTSIGNFRRESAAYEEVMQATDVALDALANGTPADLWAAGILVNKALDPTGVVRQEEAEAVGRLGSLWDQANVMLEKARSGQTMMPAQRTELSALLYSMRETSTKFQLAREARYSDEINDAGIPSKYHNNFRLATTVPAAASGEMQNVPTLPVEDIEKAASDAVFPFTDEGVKLNLKYTWGNFKDWLKGKTPTQQERQEAASERLARNPDR